MVRASLKINLKEERRKLTKKQQTLKQSWNEENFFAYQETLTLSLSDRNLRERNVEEINNRIVQSIKEAWKSSCTKKCTQTKKISEYTIGLIDSRREKASEKGANLQAYRMLSKEIAKNIRKDVRNYNTQQIKDTIEQNKSMKVLRTKLSTTKNVLNRVKDAQGNETSDRNEILKIVKDFYQQLYKSRKKAKPTSTSPRQHKLVNQGSEELPYITAHEVEAALKELKNNRAPGDDGILTEALKMGGDSLVDALKVLFNKCLDYGTTPKQWQQAEMILIHKKGDRTNLQNYRPISLLPHIYKLFTRILTKRLTSKLDFYQPVEQAGFRKGYNTNDHLLVMKILIEKTVEYNRPLVLCFIDFEKAFDSIEYWAILDALRDSRVDYRYSCILSHIYKNANSVVKLHKKTNAFKIRRGVRQGDPISPKLFNLALENIFKNLRWAERGININGERLNHLRFADDIVLISEDLNEMNQMLQELNKQAEEAGLKINISKTKLMTNLVINTNLLLSDQPVELVSSYKYLGHEITIGRDNQTLELKKRIGLGWAAFGKLRNILKSELPLCLKRKVFDQCILPVLTYGAETLTLTLKSAEKLRVAQRSMERIILGIRLSDKKPNTWIRTQTKITDVIERIVRLKWQFAGHVARLTDNRWTRKILEWRPRDSTRSRGRPPTRWTDDIRRHAGNWLLHASNRQSWREKGEAFVQQWTVMAG